MINFGEGSETGPGFVNEQRYWDLAQQFTRTPTNNIYSDWEGMAGPEHVEMILTHPEVQTQFEGAAPAPEFVRDLLAHWIYENHDQGGYLVAVGEAVEFVATIVWLFNSRFWSRKEVVHENREQRSNPS